MTLVTWLIFVTAMDPAITFMRLDEFPSPQKCEEDRQKFITDNHIPEKQARRLQCITMTNSIIKDS